MLKLNYPNFWNSKNLISLSLLPFSLIFFLLGFFRKIITKEHNLKFPVICIGNASVGGTGKTAILKAIARILISRKKKIAIISKGYGGNYVKPTIIEPSSDVGLSGDEALELADELFNIGDCTVIVAKNPPEATSILDSLKPDIILIDDGLQNPSFKKDFKILMVDGSRCFGNGFFIPAGPMRESSNTALKNADLVLSINSTSKVKNILKNENSIILTQFVNAKIKGDNEKNPDRLYLVCGIGNPERFTSYFSRGFIVVGKKIFQDHHLYTKEDIDTIVYDAKQVGANVIVTTAKDYVKLKRFKSELPVEVAKISFQEDEIEKILSRMNEKIKI